METKPLAGQSALVTGATSGIGRGVAEAFGAAGASVAVNYRNGNLDTAQGICAKICDEGGRAVPVEGDVSVESDVARMAAEVAAAFGAIDILVANSGIQKDAAFDAMSLDDWREVIDVNLTGAFLCAREVVRHFSRQKDRQVSRARGKIIFMSSVHERIPWAGHANYAASKGGIHLLMQSVAQEVASQGVRVNSIAPGFIKTHINQAVWSDEKKLKASLEQIPYGRLGDPDDIARAAIWLASDDSDYVTGTTLFVDGGMTLYPSFRGRG